MANKKIYAVVLVGGKGKRLRPLSTAAVPKAFLSITRDRKTLFRRTLDRIQGLTPAENIVVVANRSHVKLVRRDFPGIDGRNLLLEQVSRNTAPAITSAALYLKKKAPGATMVILPTDQYITEEEKFLPTIREGIKFIEGHPSAIVVLGVKPRFPSTHFGYIKASSPRCCAISKVQKFVEKPDRKTAEGYLKSGNYLWNTGAFIFKTDTALKAMKAFAPKVYNAVLRSGEDKAAYKRSPDISIDYAVIEKSRNVYCVGAEYEWHDLGGFESLIKILTREGRQFRLRGGKVVNIS